MIAVKAVNFDYSLLCYDTQMYLLNISCALLIIAFIHQ